MPQLKRYGAGRLVIKADTKIVFTTAYSEYAAESYTFQTIDYLLKAYYPETFPWLQCKKLKPILRHPRNREKSIAGKRLDLLFS